LVYTYTEDYQGVQSELSEFRRYPYTHPLTHHHTHIHTSYIQSP
jgi:hypothetical protein